MFCSLNHCGVVRVLAASAKRVAHPLTDPSLSLLSLWMAESEMDQKYSPLPPPFSPKIPRWPTHRRGSTWWSYCSKNHHILQISSYSMYCLHQRPRLPRSQKRAFLGKQSETSGAIKHSGGLGGEKENCESFFPLPQRNYFGMSVGSVISILERMIYSQSKAA